MSLPPSLPPPRPPPGFRCRWRIERCKPAEATVAIFITVASASVVEARASSGFLPCLTFNFSSSGKRCSACSTRSCRPVERAPAPPVAGVSARQGSLQPAASGFPLAPWLLPGNAPGPSPPNEDAPALALTRIAVLRHPLELDRPRLPARPPRCRQQPSKASSCSARNPPGVVVHLHPTTNPPVGIMVLRQPRNRPPHCPLPPPWHTATTRTKSPAHRRPTATALHRFDPHRPTQIRLLHIGPRRSAPGDLPAITTPGRSPQFHCARFGINTRATLPQPFWWVACLPGKVWLTSNSEVETSYVIGLRPLPAVSFSLFYLPPPASFHVQGGFFTASQAGKSMRHRPGARLLLGKKPVPVGRGDQRPGCGKQTGRVRVLADPG